MKALLSEVRNNFDKAVAMVRKTDTAILMVDKKGRPVATLKPAPKPAGFHKGKPYYTPEDLDDLGVPKW